MWFFVFLTPEMVDLYLKILIGLIIAVTILVIVGLIIGKVKRKRDREFLDKFFGRNDKGEGKK